MVVVLPWNDPLRVIEQAVVLDYLADGRFVLGIGKGEAQREFSGFGMDLDEGRRRFEDEPRPRARGARDGRAAARGRARRRDPPGAARRLQEPRPDGRRARRSRSTAPPTPACRCCASSCARWEEVAEQVERHAERFTAAVGTSRRRLRPADLRVLRPRRRHAPASSASATPAPTARARSATTAWRAGRTTCAASPRRRSGARPTRSSRSARHAARTIGTDHIAFAFRYAGVPYEEAEASMRLFAQRGPAAPVAPRGDGVNAAELIRARLQLGALRRRTTSSAPSTTSTPRSASPRRRWCRPARCTRSPSTSSPTRRSSRRRTGSTRSARWSPPAPTSAPAARPRSASPGTGSPTTWSTCRCRPRRSGTRSPTASTTTTCTTAGRASSSARRAPSANDIAVLRDRVFTRGVLADVAGHLGVDALAPDHHITVAELEATLAAQGVDVGRGDALIVRTGHLGRIQREGAWDRFVEADEPGLGWDALPWLHDRAGRRRRVRQLGVRGRARAATSSTCRSTPSASSTWAC